VRRRWFLGKTTACGFNLFHRYAKKMLPYPGWRGRSCYSLPWVDLSRLFRLDPTNWTRQRSLSALHALDGTCAVAADLYYRCDHREIDARHDELTKSVVDGGGKRPSRELVRFLPIEWRFFDCDAPGCGSRQILHGTKTTTAWTANTSSPYVAVRSQVSRQAVERA
jgi:hypothetical protein